MIPLGEDPNMKGTTGQDGKILKTNSRKNKTLESNKNVRQADFKNLTKIGFKLNQTVLCLFPPSI